MQFILKGFTEEVGCRVFAFEGIDADQSRTSFVVRTDLALSRKYGIRLQELPLLCRGLLERRDQQEEARTFTFTESDMALYATTSAVEREARQRKKPVHTPAGKQVGAAWRAPQRSDLPFGQPVGTVLPGPGGE